MRRDHIIHRFYYRNQGKKGPNGWNLCRWCGREVPGNKRKTICSENCNTMLDYMYRPAGLVWRNSDGHCAACGLDLARGEKILSKLRYMRNRVQEGRKDNWPARLIQIDKAIRKVCLHYGAPESCTRGLKGGYWWNNASTPHLWELDHILPIHTMPVPPSLEDATRFFGPENLQILCRRCHTEKTSREAGRRAKKKKSK